LIVRCGWWLVSIAMAMMAMPMGSGAVQLSQSLLNDGKTNYAGGVGHVTASGGIIKFFTISGSATVRSTGQAGERQAERLRCVRVLAPILRACNCPHVPFKQRRPPGEARCLAGTQASACFSRGSRTTGQSTRSYRTLRKRGRRTAKVPSRPAKYCSASMANPAAT
jgi:hypothetical protein